VCAQAMSPEQVAELATPGKRRAHGPAANATASRKACSYGAAVTVSDNSRYCQVCYAHWGATPKNEWLDPSKGLVVQCNMTSKGCAGCDMRVCKDCWAAYDHSSHTTNRNWVETPKQFQKHKKHRPAP
jgi:hypothetical protein